MHKPPAKTIRVKMPPSQKLELFYFRVTVQGDEIGLEQLPDFAPEATDDNGSLLSLAQFGIGLHLTWLPVKPEPNSELRARAYMKIVQYLASQMPPEEGKAFLSYPWGFGHAKGATAEWHTNTHD